MNFLISTFLIALPLLIPAVAALLARVRGLRWPVRQRPFLRAAFAFYFASLAAFAMHAAQTAGGLQAFLEAFYGAPPALTFWGYAGYAGQGLAALCIVAVINWGAVVQIREAFAKRRAMLAAAEAVKAAQSAPAAEGSEESGRAADAARQNERRF